MGMKLFIATKRLLRRIHYWAFKRRHESELAEEIETHRAMVQQQFQESGLSTTDALHASRKAVGNVVLAQEDARAVWLWPWLDRLFQDIRYGFRFLSKNLGFATAAVVSLAIAIGPNTSIFTIVNAVFLGPIGVRNMNRLFVIGSENSSFQKGQWRGTSLENFEDLRQQSTAFSDMAASRAVQLSLKTQDGNETIQGQFVTSKYFSVLGVSTILGRTFLPDEDEHQDRDRYAVISYKLWSERFNSDTNIVGKEIQLNSQSFSIVGVVAADFKGTRVLEDADRVWIPSSMVRATIAAPASDRRDTTWVVFARLRPAVMPSQATSELRMIGTRLEKDYPEVVGRAFRLDPLAQYAHGTLPGSILAVFAGMLMAAIGLVLLLACVNLANLLLARGTYREREIGIRASLGGSRSRLVRQLLTESFLLAGTGGLAGLLIAKWSCDYIWSLRPPDVRLDAMELALDWHVLTFNILTSLAAGLLFGLAPAIQLSKSDPGKVLHYGGNGVIAGGWRQSKRRSFLIVSEIALTLVALIGAGLFFRVVQSAEKLDRGFDSEHVASVAVDLGELQHEAGSDFYRNAIGRAQAIPGVAAAMVMSRQNLFATVFAESAEKVPGYQPIDTANQSVSTNFFSGLHIRMLAGRPFTESDHEGSVPVAIVSKSLAARLWPGENPLGKRFHFYHGAVMREVVGVVPEVVFVVMPDPPPVVYLPIQQVYGGSGSVFIRASKDPRLLLGPLGDALNGIDSRAVIGVSQTAEQRIERGMTAVRTLTETLSAAAVFALFLAVLGVYGVVTYSVAQRTHEFGIRIALGARRSTVLRLVLMEGLQLAFVGIVIGLFLSRLFAPIFAHFLFFGVTQSALGVYAGPALLLCTVTLLSCYVPARRSGRIDPLVALRHE
jgi:putative ABC transport system permease protein